MSEYRVNFVPFNNIKNGRCEDMEKKLEELLANQLQVLCMAPYTLMSPGQPMMDAQGQLRATPPKMAQGLVIVTEHVEGTVPEVN